VPPFGILLGLMNDLHFYKCLFFFNFAISNPAFLNLNYKQQKQKKISKANKNFFSNFNGKPGTNPINNLDPVADPIKLFFMF